jgi:hypothetical protein
MDKITSQAFYRAWIKSVNNRKEHLLQIWRLRPNFTSYIMSDDNSVMEDVAKELGLDCYPRDNYFIDTILYDKQDLVPGLGEGQYWFRDIRVAFEHEHDFNSKLYQETSHLLITNCDLRVLVTYPPNNEEIEKTHLDRLHEIIKGTRQSKLLSDNESFLIILGYQGDFGWLGFVYKEDKWTQITL